MEKFFTKNAYPPRFTIQKLAEKLRLNERKVYTWFSFERMRVRYGKCQETQDIGEFVGLHIVQV